MSNNYKEKLMKISKNSLVMEEIDNLLNDGVKDKLKLFTNVSERLNVPIPIVRRIARYYRLELLNKIKVLQGDFDKPNPKYVEDN